MDRYEQYIGTVLENRYRLTELVGKGGMAVVYKATDISMNRTVAVKILNDENNNDEVAVKRFFTESKAIAMLSHTNIVAIYDVSPASSKQKFIIMEFIDGITLKDYLDKKGSLEWTEACHYTAQILSALHHAHGKGVVHRDIKPQNIMLLRDGTIKVTDFGIAKISNAPSLTATDKAIGTVNYISPEQASGRIVDFHSDIYSTGVMLYEMVSGKLPFTAESSVSVAMMHVQDEPVAPSAAAKDPANVPYGLEQIILKAMKKNPADRFGSANSMQRAIEYLVANPTIRFTERQKPRDEHADIVSGGASSKTSTGGERVPVKAGTGTNSLAKQKKKAKKRRRTTSMLPIVAGVTFAFLIVVFVCVGRIVLDVLSSSNSDKNEVIIPNVVGEIYTKEFEAKLAEQNYKVKIEYTYNRMAEKNEIMNQYPEKLSRKIMTPSGIDLVIYVNKGDDDVSLKDYSVVNLEDARLELEALGLEVEVAQEFHDTIIEGYIIRTEPKDGTKLVRGDSITLFVSKGQDVKPIAMPNVTGKTYEQAERELISLGFAIGERKLVPSEAKEGTVTDTSVPVGEDVFPRTTSIDIYVSKGPIIMPNILGKNFEEAFDILEEQGITVGSYTYAPSKYPEDTVAETSVEPGKFITEETVCVDITISLGETLMPNLVNTPYDSAETKLYALGLYQLEKIEVEDDEIPAGNVISTSIPEGTSIEDSSEKITIYVSLGKSAKDEDEENGNDGETDDNSDTTEADNEQGTQAPGAEQPQAPGNTVTTKQPEATQATNDVTVSETIGAVSADISAISPEVEVE